MPTVSWAVTKVEYWIQLWDPQHRRDKDRLKQLQKRSMKIIRQLEHLFCDEMLR